MLMAHSCKSDRAYCAVCGLGVNMVPKPRTLKNMIFHLALSISVLVFVFGCTVFVDFEDISHNKEYRELMNTTYKTKERLLIYGVNMDKVIQKVVHQYTVVNESGFSGREVVTRNLLPYSTIIQIKKVLSCTNCYLDFSPRIKYLIEILSDQRFQDHKVYLNDSFGEKQNSLTWKGQIKMNPNIFVLIETVG